MTKVETHINGQFWMFISSLAQLIRERGRERERERESERSSIFSIDS